MLKELSIKNFTIIDDLNISFSDGLTVLSGETGAGKSIIINAVNLLLGSRATAKLIRTGTKTAELEAIFQVGPESKTAAAMEGSGFDPSQGLLIRRVISHNNRHKIYLNGHLSTMQMLTSITENLASISGQHAHQGLLLEEQHLLILDQFGGLMPLRDKVGALYHEIIPLIRKLKDQKALQGRQAQQMELLEFQKKEIEDAAILPDEDMVLEKERLKLKNAEALYQWVYSSVEGLYDTQGAVAERLNEIKTNLEKACRIDSDLSTITGEVDEVTFKIEDITQGLRAYLKNIELDENSLEAVEDRLDLLGRLKKKYGGSLESVFLHLKATEKELSTVGNLSHSINETEEELSRCHEKLAELTEDLSKKRGQAAKKISRKVEKELAGLKMSNTKFKVDLHTTPAGSNDDTWLSVRGKAMAETGIDHALFLIAPNVGESLKPLANIASGGELSRMVLALKAILADNDSVETVVFDEVDAGIGGSVAEIVGRKLAALADYHQIICITHLAQIAKFGDHHFQITKQVSGGRTRTAIKPLNPKERVDEIARMIGGEKITRATLDHAQEMLAVN